VVAFQGLKRKLGIHQETLARSLARLQKDGFIEKSAEGYRISRKAASNLHDAQPSVVMPVIRSYLPFSIDLQSLINVLRGTWFGKLRWFGHSINSSESILTWVTDEGSIQVELKITNASITVQARVKESADVREAVIAAHEVYTHVSETYTKELKKSGILLGAQVS
jgi:hypothetical protein